MKKKEFTELVRLSLPIDYNPLLIEKYISIAYNTFVKSVFNSNRIYNDNYTKEYELDVTKDDNTGNYYSIIPVGYIKLNRPGSGIINIDTLGTADLNFVPMTDANYKIVNNLTALKLKSYIPYIVVENKIKYMVKFTGIEKVNVRLLPVYEAYDSDDDVYMPEGTELNIRDAVYQLMTQHVVRDQVIDANQKTK